MQGAVGKDRKTGLWRSYDEDGMSVGSAPTREGARDKLEEGQDDFTFDYLYSFLRDDDRLAVEGVA